MQINQLNLKEIVWEITGKCNNNCDYCGSSIVNKNQLSDSQIYELAKIISEYPPSEIDISGGDPLLLNYALHFDIVDLFKAKNIVCKILFNPKSLLYDYEKKYRILKLYDWIGISINTLQDIINFNKFKELCPDITNYTIITNFNVSNLYDYTKFESVVQENKVKWMIQYTMYQDKNNPLAIYNNQSALEYLANNVALSINKKLDIVLSDNANNSKCGAGLQSIGINWNGYVMPCLSMRSWKSDISSEGYLFKRSLKDIWENEFKEYRYCEFVCCKDHCNNKRLLDYVAVSVNPKSEPFLDDIVDQWKKIIEQNTAVLYAVNQNPYNPYRPYNPYEPNIMAYAVPGGQIMAYAVTPNYNNLTGASSIILKFEPKTNIKNEDTTESD